MPDDSGAPAVLFGLGPVEAASGSGVNVFGPRDLGL